MCAIVLQFQQRVNKLMLNECEFSKKEIINLKFYRYTACLRIFLNQFNIQNIYIQFEKLYMRL